MRVDYRIGFNEYVSEWVCFEHTGYPRRKAEQWWQTRSNEPVPGTAEEAVELADAGVLAPTLAITVERRAGERFDRVVAYRLGDKPVCGSSGSGAASNERAGSGRSCPNCGHNDRTIQPGTGPHVGQEVCAWCGRWLRWVPKDEYERRLLDEVPF